VIAVWLRRRRLVAGIVAAGVLVAAGLYALADSIYSRAVTRIAVSAVLITSFDNRDPSRGRFGELKFRGGLALASSYEPIGGISAIHVELNGSHFFALTDKGSWLHARIMYENGKPLAARRWFETESLAEVDCKPYVGIERVEKIMRFEYRRYGLATRGEPIKVPDDFKTFSYNKSLECLAVPPKGSPLAGQLVVVTEHSRRRICCCSSAAIRCCAASRCASTASRSLASSRTK
jgi:hypothetical protein